MAFVMGISSAQAGLLNVQDYFIESSGVYAILNSPPFRYIIYYTGFWKNQKRGVGAIFFGANCPSSSTTECWRRYFWMKFGLDHDGWDYRLARARKISGEGL
jgi:hypothetical protein